MKIEITRLNLYDAVELKTCTFSNNAFPEHFHDTCSIGVLKQGTETNIIEGDTMLAHANSMVIINPHQVHANKSFDRDESIYQCIYVNSDAFKFIAEKFGIPFHNHSFINNPVLPQDSIRQFFHLYNQASDIQQFSRLFEHFICSLLTQCLQLPGIADTNFRRVLTSLEDTLFLMQHRFTDKLNLDDMARNCKLSKFQFIRYFSKMTGLTPASYIMVCRINHAKSLLMRGYSIIHTALESGFYDQSHFCRYFKRYIGISPVHYQRSCNIVQVHPGIL